MNCSTHQNVIMCDCCGSKINITNDLWFGKKLGPYQHFYLAKLRAAEINKPTIRVSNNGISALIDKNGNIKSYLKLNETTQYSDTIKVDFQRNFYFLQICFKYILLSFILTLIISNSILKNDKKKSKL